MTSSMSSLVLLVAILVVASSSSISCSEHRCGNEGGGALCEVGRCCSRWDWCGDGDEYCAPENCQSQCSVPSPPHPPPPASPPPPVYDITDTIDRTMFDEMFPNTNLDEEVCVGPSYYNYDNFVTAARSFPGFGTSGDIIARKREIAAFLGQTGYETAFESFPDREIFEYGYCRIGGIIGRNRYCIEDPKWPCPRLYFGRGPIMLKYNYNYGQAGEALGLGLGLLEDPNLILSDPILGFKTAIWFWMTEQLPKPSCHNVMTGNWTPSVTDLRAQRLPGYGLTTNIITSNHDPIEFECGKGQDKKVQDRITFYQRACNILGVDPGLNLDCFEQTPFDLISKLWNTGVAS